MWKSVEDYFGKCLKTSDSEERQQILELSRQIQGLFPNIEHDYQAVLDDEYKLEQPLITRAFGKSPWLNLVDKPVRKNLSLLYSLAEESFAAILPAAMITAFCDGDTWNGVCAQLGPGQLEFFNRMDRLDGDQYRLVRQWIHWAQESDEFKDCYGAERIWEYWRNRE